MISQLADLILQLNSIFSNQLGITIIVIGVAIRLAFYPLIKNQLIHTKKMRDLQPKINELKKKFKDDKMQLAQAQNELFKTEGINPLAGCLPLVVQLIIFSILYNVIVEILNRGIPTQFLFFDLAKPDVFNFSPIPFPIPGILAVLASLTQFILSKMMMPEPVPVNPKDDKKEIQEKADFMQEFAEAQNSLIWLFPLIFLVMASNFPSGLALYWTSSTVVAIIQQWQFAGPGGLKSLLAKANIQPK